MRGVEVWEGRGGRSVEVWKGRGGRSVEVWECGGGTQRYRGHHQRWVWVREGSLLGSDFDIEGLTSTDFDDDALLPSV